MAFNGFQMTLLCLGFPGASGELWLAGLLTRGVFGGGARGRGWALLAAAQGVVVGSVGALWSVLGRARGVLVCAPAP